MWVLLRWPHCDVIYEYQIWRRCHWNRLVMNSVPLLFFFAKWLHANSIHSLMHPVCGDTCSKKPTVHAWCQKMLARPKFASGTELQSVVLRWLWQQPHCSLHWEFRSLVADGTNVSMKSEDTSKNETVPHLNPSQTGRYSIYSGEMEGWVDLWWLNVVM